MTNKEPIIEFERELIDVTSNHRPDLNWIFFDSSGHCHQWHNGQILAVKYSPAGFYHVPSIKWVKTGVDYYPDGSEYEVGYYACIDCGEEITPGYTADTTTQYITGVTRYYVDGKEVKKEELEAIMKSYEGLVF